MLRNSLFCGSENDVQPNVSPSHKEILDQYKSIDAEFLKERSQTVRTRRSLSFYKTLRRKSDKIFQRRSADYQHGSIVGSLLQHVTETAYDDDTSVAGQNKLHVACMVRSPLFIVEAIIRDFPKYVSESDSMNRLPLHVAAARGSCPEVIRYILKKNPEAASLQDVKGKTPLILLCEHSYKERAYDSGRTRQDSLKGTNVSVIKALCKEAPRSVNVEDKSGINALRYALEMGASSKVVSILHKASRIGWESSSSLNSKEGVFKKDNDREELSEINKRPLNSLNDLPQVPVAKVSVAKGA